MRKAWIVAAAVLGVTCGPAGLAQAQNQNPSIVIEQLELAGYQVNIDRIGSAPIGECEVTNVRNPQQQTRLISDDDGHGLLIGGLDVFEVVVRQSISVSLDCTR